MDQACETVEYCTKQELVTLEHMVNAYIEQLSKKAKALAEQVLSLFQCIEPRLSSTSGQELMPRDPWMCAPHII